MCTLAITNIVYEGERALKEITDGHDEQGCAGSKNSSYATSKLVQKKLSRAALRESVNMKTAQNPIMQLHAFNEEAARTNTPICAAVTRKRKEPSPRESAPEPEVTMPAAGTTYTPEQAITHLAGLPNALRVATIKAWCSSSGGANVIPIQVRGIAKRLKLFRNGEMSKAFKPWNDNYMLGGLNSKLGALNSNLPPLTKGWQEYTAPCGNQYYHKAASNITQWERPAEMDAAVSKLPLRNTGEMSHGDTANKRKEKSSKSVIRKSAHAQQEPILSKGTTKNGMAVEAVSKPTSGNGWKEYTAPGANKYYHNATSNTIQWNRPAQMDEKKAKSSRSGTQSHPVKSSSSVTRESAPEPDVMMPAAGTRYTPEEAITHLAGLPHALRVATTKAWCSDGASVIPMQDRGIAKRLKLFRNGDTAKAFKAWNDTGRTNIVSSLELKQWVLGHGVGASFGKAEMRQMLEDKLGKTVSGCTVKTYLAHAKFYSTTAVDDTKKVDTAQRLSATSVLIGVPIAVNVADPAMGAAAGPVGPASSAVADAVGSAIFQLLEQASLGCAATINVPAE